MLPDQSHNNFELRPLVSSSHLLKSAIDASNAAILITDNSLSDNPIIYCNSSFEKLTGYTAAETIGKNCRFLQGKHPEKAQRKLIRDALSNGLEVVVEIRNQKKNGDLFWNELHIAPIKNEFGKTTHFIGIQHDITQKKKCESQANQTLTSTNQETENKTGIPGLKDILKDLSSLLPFK